MYFRWVSCTWHQLRATPTSNAHGGGDALPCAAQVEGWAVAQHEIAVKFLVEVLSVMMAENRGKTVPRLPTFCSGLCNAAPTHYGAVRRHTQVRSSRVVKDIVRLLCPYSRVKGTGGCVRFAVELHLSRKKNLRSTFYWCVCFSPAMYPRVNTNFVLEGLQPMELLDQHKAGKSCHDARTGVQLRGCGVLVVHKV